MHFQVDTSMGISKRKLAPRNARREFALGIGQMRPTDPSACPDSRRHVWASLGKTQPTLGTQCRLRPRSACRNPADGTQGNLANHRVCDAPIFTLLRSTIGFTTPLFDAVRAMQRQAPGVQSATQNKGAL